MPLKILTYPHPALSSICEKIENFDSQLQSLADDLYKAMLAAPGIGITAAHVGILKRLVIIDLPTLGGRQNYVNPEIIAIGDIMAEHEEGSVCMPGMTEKVTRPQDITISYQNLDGTPAQTTLTGFAATCMQHEIDQLNGLFWTTRLSRLKRDRLLKKWQKRETNEPNRAPNQ